jgi:hypothetical protein
VQEPDKIHSGKIILIGVVSVIFFILGGIWAGRIEKTETVPPPSEAKPATYAHKPEVGIVYQTPFNMSSYADDFHEKKEEWLTRYGWVDREHKVVHIPIDVAIDRVAQQAGAGK